VHWLSNNGDGHVEEDQPEHDGKPQQKRNDPILVIAMLNEGCNPPAGYCQSCDARKSTGTTTRKTYPVKNAPITTWTQSR
jgi:hypothetical protein